MAASDAVLSERQVLERLSQIADADIRQVIDGYGRLLHPHDWPAGFAQAVASIEVGSDGRPTKLKLWSKPQALDLLARHHGLLAKDHAQATESLMDRLGRDAVQALRAAAVAELTRRKAITVDAEPAGGAPEPQHIVGCAEKHGVLGG
jgi:hypothetical protein